MHEAQRTQELGQEVTPAGTQRHRQTQEREHDEYVQDSGPKKAAMESMKPGGKEIGTSFQSPFMSPRESLSTGFEPVSTRSNHGQIDQWLTKR